MRSLILASAAIIAFASGALAADPPRLAPVLTAPAPAFSWAGPYAGVHGGFLWGDVDIDDDGIAAAGTVDGFVGGVLAGYNLQANNFVFGIEADIGWTGASGTGESEPPATDTYTYDVNWLAHLRGRLGLPVGNTLFFVAGGLAIADLNVTENQSENFGGNYFGWSIGLGLDHAFSRNLVGRLELIYDDFGSKSYDGGAYTVDFNAMIARAAIVFRF